MEWLVVTVHIIDGYWISDFQLSLCHVRVEVVTSCRLILILSFYSGIVEQFGFQSKKRAFEVNNNKIIKVEYLIENLYKEIT